MDGERVSEIVEKPESPPSKYAVTGIYFYDDQVWDVLPTLQPSGRGELEITDVNNWYVARGEMAADVVDGFWATRASRSRRTTRSTTSCAASAHERHDVPAHTARGRAGLVLRVDPRVACRSRSSRRTSRARVRA